MKSWISLVLAMLLIGCCGILPRLAGEITDRLNRNQSGTAPIQSVELTLSGSEQEQPGYMLRKLALERDMTTLPIAAEQASMTEEEVIAAAVAGMDIYIDAGIFDWFDYTYQGVEAYLGIQPSDKHNHAIFWSVTFINESEPYNCLFLHIDDETGKIIYIKYEDGGPARLFTDKEAAKRVMDRFIQAFLSPLSLMPEQVWEYENLEGTVSQSMLHDSELSMAAYSCRDLEYGRITVEFNIIPCGFYVYFVD